MKLGYIHRRNLELNPKLTERFVFKECTFTRRISSKSDKVYSELLYPVDHEEVVFNTGMMKKDGLILVDEPFLLDDELREKAVRWVEWANKANPEGYSFLSLGSEDGRGGSECGLAGQHWLRETPR